MAVATFAGVVLEFTHSHLPMFLAAGFAYLAALALVQWLVPKLGPVELEA